MIRLAALGRLELQDGDRPLLAGRRKVLALLTYLARRAGRPVRRERLAALLWPGADEPHARQSLRQALLELRGALCDGVRLEEHDVRVDPHSITLDAVAFEQEVAAGDWEVALGRWSGNFLDGLEDLGDEEWRAWLEAERTRLRTLFVWAADRLVARCESEGRWRDAARWAECWVAAFPGDERAASCVVRSLRAAGRTSEAAARHAQLVRTLTDYSGRKPSTAFLRLAKDSVDELPPPRPGTRGLLSPDLVGRDRQLEGLSTAWSAVRRSGAAPSGRVVGIEADEGLGLTRLCGEFGRVLELSDGKKVVLTGRAFPAEHDRPMAAIRPLLDQLAGAPGLGGARPEVLAVLASVSPAIRARFPDAGPPAQASVEEAFAEALAIVAVDAPVAVLLDDAPAAGIEDQRVLAALVRRTPPGVLVVLLGRSADWKDSALDEQTRHLPHASRLTLEPLSEEETLRLVASIAPMQDDVARALAHRLHDESGGRPALIQLLVETLAEDRLLAVDAGGRWTLTTPLDRLTIPLLGGIRELMLTRLRHLPDPARRVLEVAAAIGPRIELPLLEEVAGLESAELREALGELVARRLLRPSRDPGTPFEFPGEAERRAIYDLIMPSSRRALHRRAARALSAGDDADRKALAAGHRRLGRRGRDRRALLAAGLGAILVPALIALWRGGASGVTAAAERRLVVVAFENETGDPALAPLGRIAADWLSQGIGRTGLVRVSPPALNPPARNGPHGTGDRDQQARRVHELALDTRADLVVWGSYYRSGDSIHFQARLTDARADELLSTIGPEGALFASPMVAIEALRRKALAALAPWLDPRLAAAARVQASPPSYEAYRVFADGLDFFYKRVPGAVERFLKAYTLDTTYVLPLLYAIWENQNTGGLRQNDSLLQILLLRRAELTPYDRYALDLQVARAKGDWNGQYTAARAAADLAPQSFVAAYSLPQAARALNRPGEALEFLSRIDPDRGEASRLPGYWAQLSQALHMMDHFERQLEVGKEVRRRFPEDVRWYGYQAQALAALGRLAALDVVLGESLLIPPHPAWGAPGITTHLVAADELNAHGNPSHARTVLERALRFAQELPPAIRRLPAHRFDQGKVLFRLGRLGAARQLFDSLLAEAAPGENSVDLRARIGMVAALQGDLRTVEAMDRWLRDPGIPYLFGQNTEFRAGIQALLGNREAAVRLLRQAMAEGRSYDSGKHIYPEYAGLRGYRPFEEWLRPKG